MHNTSNAGEDGGPAIFKIIYHSNIIVQGGADSILTNVRDILKWSRSWNRKHGITGALVLSDNNFAQVLEGPSHSVKALYGHIACDRRHKNVQLLMHDFFPKRDFPNWSMAYIASDNGPIVNLATDPRSSSPDLTARADRVLHFLLRAVMRDQIPAPE